MGTDFVIHKAKLLDRLKGRINARQEKVLLEMFREGPEGFEGGRSAKKYSTIAETPPRRRPASMKTQIYCRPAS
jgi:hypothetical protein